MSLQDGLGSYWLVVWPAGYALKSNEIVDGSGNHVAKIGDQVDLGGGQYSDANIQSLLAGSVPAACRTTQYWLTVTVSAVP